MSHPLVQYFTRIQGSYTVLFGHNAVACESSLVLKVVTQQGIEK